MTSYRDRVNEAIKTALSGHTAAQDRVHTSLDRPLKPDDDLPCIMVYAGEAVRGPQDYGNSLIPRVIEVTIECAAYPDNPLHARAEAEALADQIETALEADPTLGRVVQKTRWQRSVCDTATHGEYVIGVGLLQYEVTILTNERQPEWFGVGDDGFTTPPSHVSTIPDASTADFGTPHTGGCGPDGCAPPFWDGEVTP